MEQFLCVFFTVNKCFFHYETPLDYQHDCDFHFLVNFSFNWCNSLQQSATCWRWSWATISLSCPHPVVVTTVCFKSLTRTNPCSILAVVGGYTVQWIVFCRLLITVTMGCIFDSVGTCQSRCTMHRVERWSLTPRTVSFYKSFTSHIFLRQCDKNVNWLIWVSWCPNMI